MTQTTSSKSDTDTTQRKSRYHWLETTESTHRYLTDHMDSFYGKKAFIVLGIVTVLAIVLGAVLIRTMPLSSDMAQSNPLTSSLENKEKMFLLDESFVLTVNGVKAVTRGPDNQFFLMTPDMIFRYNREGKKLREWKIPLVENKEGQEEVPSAICYVDSKNINHPFAGKLLFSRGSKVISLDPNKEITTTSSLPFKPEAGTVITSITYSDDYLFFGDYHKRIVYRFKQVEPEKLLIIGREDESSGFPGVTPTQAKRFDIAFSKLTNSVLMVNSACFRLEAFDPETGIWQKDQSWGEGPWNPNGFTGSCNPVALALFSNGLILASDKGKKPLVRIFNEAGRYLCTVNDPLKTPELEGSSTLLTTPLNNNSVLILLPSGQIQIYERKISKNLELNSTQQVPPSNQDPS